MFPFFKNKIAAPVQTLQEQIAESEERLAELLRQRTGIEKEEDLRQTIEVLEAEKLKLEEEKETAKEQLRRTQVSLEDAQAAEQRQKKDLEADKERFEKELELNNKVKEEREKLERQQFELTTTQNAEAAIADVKDSYRDKLESFLTSQIESGDERFEQILQRLPDSRVLWTNQSESRTD